MMTTTQRQPMQASSPAARVRYTGVTSDRQAVIEMQPGKYTADELREAAHLFNQIAEWLDASCKQQQ